MIYKERKNDNNFLHKSRDLVALHYTYQTKINENLKS